jgi:hypothetical protein
VIPDRPDLVRDGNKIAPDVKFWCYPLGTCTALARPDERGRFRAMFVQHLADGRRQEVIADFHVGMVAR